jgi:hypothetical protein
MESGMSTTTLQLQEIISWPHDVVARFETERDDILILERPSLEINPLEMLTGQVHEYRASVNRRTVKEHASRALAELALVCSSLEKDIKDLAQSFLSQFRRKSINFRVEIAETQLCPKFHCDNVNIRLVTTYLGPGTEYQLADDDSVHQASLNSLVFLKGHRHRTHSDRVLHRSPEVPMGVRRLCVVIDF